MKKTDNKQLNKQYKITITGVLILVFFAMFFLRDARKITYATDELVTEEAKQSIEETEKPQNRLDILKIMEENTQNKKKEELLIEETDLEYITTYQENKELPKGSMQVVQEGRDGKQQVVTKKIYEGDNLVKEEQSSNRIIRSSVNKIVEIGAGSYKSNYKVKVGDKLYVTSNILGIMLQPSNEAERIYTLNKNDEVKLIEIQGTWYKITYGSYTGYVAADCLTYINPNKTAQDYQTQEGKSKEQLTAKLSRNMALNKPSGLSLDQFKKILSDSQKDTKNIFSENAEYFYYIEKQYNINGVFVAAVGIHESAWGTSTICQKKKNLFGYGAYDSDPYGGAYSFSSYSESIDLIARVFVKYYLNPAGTSIYDGQKATGRYYNGSTLDAVNQKYATDKNWANSVYKWMSYLYGRL